MKKTILLFSALLIFGNLSAQDKAALVNPIIGTNGMGHTFPGACVPFGLVQLSPDTDTIPHNVDGKYQPRAYEYCAGYQHKDSSIVGFSHTHFSGTGHSDLGDILIMPATGELKLNPGTATDPDGGYRSRFSHDTEVSRPGYYEVMLADYGANVIKIEVPKGGDDTRSYPPFRAKNLNGERESVYFANINRNKKGITLNLKAPEGKEIFKELVKKADIVVENYRPGVMDKLGLGYDVLKEINPRIIYAAVSGFGCYGPYHLRPGYDILAQAMGGMMSITGSKGGEPTRAGSALGDILGGLHVTIGILAAVNARTITGKGQRVDVSLMDSMIAATENTALKYIETGNIPAPMGNRYAAVSPYDSFTCKGGKVIIAAGNQKLYEKLCNEVLERPDMITDPRFVDMPGRLANQDAIAEVIEERIKDLTPNEAAELVLAHGIPAGPIMNIKEILDDPHVKEREMFVEMDHPTLGKVTVNGCAIKLMDTKPSVRTPAPQLGQNNRDIFEGVLGMTEEQFNTLHEKQVF